MTTRIEGQARNYNTGKLCTVNDVLETGTEYQSGTYLLHKNQLLTFTILDTPDGAVIDEFGALSVLTRKMDLYQIKGEYGEVFHQNGAIIIDGTVELWRHEEIFLLGRLDMHRREHIRISFSLPREIIYSFTE